MKKQYVCPVCGPQEKPCSELAKETNATLAAVKLSSSQNPPPRNAEEQAIKAWGLSNLRAIKRP